ncbi:hypothetical protein [Streptomyces sp. NBC_01803]|uniref:hypothetical protein n=1 Tax=Streptomyces sp. NBC_01803 TaxID=2975946 RepID=UPI002DD9F5C8|nr:hypothetical protein [Streptomyces sp. NBC_01803]WSA43712.1 hypothetical protein OIE51_05550 [Streptomyces sp. NBC_01803]
MDITGRETATLLKSPREEQPRISASDPAAMMPSSAEDIIAMQERGDQAACREQIETADDRTRGRVMRRWWIRGLASQRPGRADEYAARSAAQPPCG